MDGITGETYKALGEWVIKPITQIRNKIHREDTLPPEWANGKIVRIQTKRRHPCSKKLHPNMPSEK